MFNSKSYVKWQARLKQLIPDTCASRLTNLALLIVGIKPERVLECASPKNTDQGKLQKHTVDVSR